MYDVPYFAEMFNFRTFCQYIKEYSLILNYPHMVELNSLSLRFVLSLSPLKESMNSKQVLI